MSRIATDSARPPAVDPKAATKWRILQICLRCVRTIDGKPRAGGDLKTVAAGQNYKTTLTMPEEGQSITVVHARLSDAWDAVEEVLEQPTVPWVDCSEFALKRAKRRNDKVGKTP